MFTDREVNYYGKTIPWRFHPDQLPIAERATNHDLLWSPLSFLFGLKFKLDIKCKKRSQSKLLSAGLLTFLACGSPQTVALLGDTGSFHLNIVGIRLSAEGFKLTPTVAARFELWWSLERFWDEHSVGKRSLESSAKQAVVVGGCTLTQEAPVG